MAIKIKEEKAIKKPESQTENLKKKLMLQGYYDVANAEPI
jgi:hypothetical protein